PACDAFRDAAALESHLAFERINAERQRFAAELTARLSSAEADRLGASALSYRLGRTTPVVFHRELKRLALESGLGTEEFPALHSYFDYLEAADRVHPDAVMAELDRLESAGFDRFARSDEERDLVEQSELHHLAGRLIAHTLTPTEWTRYVALRDKREDDAIAGISSFEDFYAAAEARDAAMASRLTNELRRRDAREAVMVVGGYHVPGLSRRLSDAGYRVVSFTPAVSKVDDAGGSYLSVFLSERTPLERLFKTPQLTLAPEPEPAAVAHAELPGLVTAEDFRAGDIAAADAARDFRELAPASGVVASRPRRSGRLVDVFLTLAGRRWRLEVENAPGEKSTRGPRIARTSVNRSPEPAELTASLLANVFGGTPARASKWSALNWLIRIPFAGAIIPHELGHLFVGPESGRRFEYGWRRTLGGLFYGMPWKTRGPPALAGMIINLAILISLEIVYLSLGGPYFVAHPYFFAAVVYFSLANLLFVAAEIILTPYARRLGITRAPDLYFLENGETLKVVRPSSTDAPRKHLLNVDLSGVPAAARADAERAFEELAKRRPIPGRVRFVDALPEGPRVHAVDAFVAWDTDGFIYIRPALLGLLANDHSPAFPVPDRETPVFRGLIVAILNASFQFQHLNRHPKVALPTDFEHWKNEADERFTLSSTVSSYELLDQFEQQFESPKSMAIEKIRWAAHELGLTPLETTQLVEADWTYRFEIPVPLDKGGTATVVAWRVQHNDALGQNKGGLRYGPELDEPTAGDLSREMSIKVAVVNLPLGGGKGGGRLDVKLFSQNELSHFTRGLARELHRLNAVGPEIDVPAPDMNTGAATMAWFADEYIRLETEAGRITHPDMTALLAAPAANVTNTPFLDRYAALFEAGQVDGKPLAVVTGKPVDKGGIIGREEATARGGYFVALEAVKHYLGRKDLSGLRVSIQGFGNVGYWMAKILHDAGVKVVAVSEIAGSAYNPDGIDINALKAHYDATKSFAGFTQTGTDIQTGSNVGDLPLYAPADIVIPAANKKQLRTDNVDRIHPDVKMIIELANNPTTPGAEDKLHRERPKLVIIPDVLANAGGVTVSHFEWQRNMGQLPKDITLDQVRGLLHDIMVPAAR
ncbi:MAG: Glu/Leu/Phe/Val dehydrogenase, partial [Elusimicrobia bacterium]|nr:Glu/Leu/Phe/Val dehydrogenase [Elusimicrobiota bacterium]